MKETQKGINVHGVRYSGSRPMPDGRQIQI